MPECEVCEEDVDELVECLTCGNQCCGDCLEEHEHCVSCGGTGMTEMPGGQWIDCRTCEGSGLK